MVKDDHSSSPSRPVIGSNRCLIYPLCTHLPVRSHALVSSSQLKDFVSLALSAGHVKELLEARRGYGDELFDAQKRARAVL